MTADKRKVATDALETLGTIIGVAEARDAIHLAVEPIEAGTTLSVGAHVVMRDGKAYACPPGDGVGIVDPFLMRRVEKGERFWLVVYPRTITSLRHVWAHPAFAAAEVQEDSESPPSAAEKAVSEQWLRDFCANHDAPDYDLLIEALRDGDSSSKEDQWGDFTTVRLDGEYIHVSGSDAHGSIPAEFWTHAEIVTGRKFDKADRAEWFTCSC